MKGAIRRLEPAQGDANTTDAAATGKSIRIPYAKQPGRVRYEVGMLDLLPVRRAIAILAFIGLLAGPVSAWSMEGCCGDADCCKSGICPMRAKQANSQHADEAMHCHRSDTAPAPASNCDAGAQCRGQAHPLRPAPLPRAVLPDAPAIAVPKAARTELQTSAPIPVKGFLPTPFQPPRLSA